MGQIRCSQFSPSQLQRSSADKHPQQQWRAVVSSHLPPRILSAERINYKGRPSRGPPTEAVATSQTLDEASCGDPVLAAERMQVLAGIPLLPNAPQITQIANEIMTRAILPPSAQVDVLHIATVAHHRIQYLLT
jgi:hypothetical protein